MSKRGGIAEEIIWEEPEQAEDNNQSSADPFDEPSERKRNRVNIEPIGDKEVSESE